MRSPPLMFTRATAITADNLHTFTLHGASHQRVPTLQPQAEVALGKLPTDEASAACIFSYSAVPAPSILRHSNKPIRTAMACTAFFAPLFHVAMLGFSRPNSELSAHG